jgi:hypothetical protein
MALSRKAVSALALLAVCAIGAGSYAWFNRGPSQDEKDKEAQEAKARQIRDTKAAERLVEVKNESLGQIENGEFAPADPSLLHLATAGARDPVGRDWTIERLMAVEAMDLKRDPAAYDDALERAQTAVNLENALEPKSPERHYLAAKLGQARNSPKVRVFEQHIAAGTAPGDPLMWWELYQAQLSAGTPKDIADSEGTLKSLKDLVPENLYVQLEWLRVQARQKDPKILTHSLLAAWLTAILREQGGDAETRFATLWKEIRAAADAKNWTTVSSKASALVEMVKNLPEVQADRRRIERGLSWHIVSDFTHKYYQKHHIDRRLPSADKPVEFREVELSDALAKITDAQEARFVDFDLNGRHEIAVLRGESFDVFARDKSGRWEKVASVPLPRGGYEHFLPVPLGGDPQVPASDVVLYGPGGVLVLANSVASGGASRTLKPVETPALSAATKDAMSIVACDLNEDGLIDLIVSSRSANSAARDSALLRVFLNQGDRHFRDTTPYSGFANVPVGTTALVAVDWDNDLDVDLLVPWVADPAGSPGGITFLHGLGMARFRTQLFRVKDSDIQSATALAVLDADSNGSWDLLASNLHGTFLLLTSTTEHGRVETIGVEPVSDFPAERVLVFDYDNDGCPDLLAWNRDGVRCFHGSVEGHFEPVERTIPPGLGAISSADVGDFDQDGDGDLLVVKSSGEQKGGRVALLRNEGGNANNWIDVRLDARPANEKATGPNRVPAIGLGGTLCLKITGLSQTQIVQKPVTHFGIGSKEGADVLRILWNTGVPANVLGPTKNTTVTQRPPAKTPQ